MKFKEGRDYLDFEYCIVEVEGRTIVMSDMCSIFRITEKEFHRMVKFVNKKFKEEREE